MTKIQPIGQFNRRLEAQKLTLVADDAGGQVETWTTIYTTQAYIGPVKSWRSLQLLQNVQSASYDVQIRFTRSHEVSTDIRFIYEGQTLIINRMEQVTEGRKRFWSLTLTEQV
jgi:SPP1 family predicted phage head-tail adaptor